MGVLFDDEMVKRITKQLMDEGRVIEAGWTGYRVLCLPEDTPPEVEAAFRRVYFTGAKCLMTALEITRDASGHFRDKRVAQLTAELDRWDGLMRERQPGRPH
jgi:hypothetical protein